MTLSRAGWIGIAVGLAVAAAVLFAAITRIDARSDAILTARHPLPPSPVVAATSPQAVAEGARLVAYTTCASCHGVELTGGPLNVALTQVYTGNLTREVRKLSDADLDRAIRWGLRPDRTAELIMPSQAYRGLTDTEMAEIIGYLRSLPPKGVDLPKLRPGFVLRANLAFGVVKTSVRRLDEARPPLDAGPATAAGRHLAAVACGRCHGTDLGGIEGVGPDMTVRGYYRRDQFHALIHKGDAIGEGNMQLMIQTAQASFSHFTDAEVDQIYDYLMARDRILAAKPK